MTCSRYMTLSLLLCLSACALGRGAAAEEQKKPANTAEFLQGKWEGTTPKGKFDLVFDEKGAFVSGHFFNFPLSKCTIKSVSPMAFEVVYAIEKMGGMTVTVQFKDGQIGKDFKSVTGTFNTMLDKGEFKMAKGDAPAEKKAGK
ncbi:MAG: hypothetical protein HY291_01820 [Planctomycetes bacterium]|nr:hypothetical protein [Planctomycetota bacterium]